MTCPGDVREEYTMSTLLSPRLLRPVPVAGSSAVIPLKRKRSKRGEGDRLREEILDAVDAILSSHASPDAVSIRAVAEKVGCTPPAIYLHFFDKQEMLFDVCARQFTKLNSAIDAAVDAVSVTDPLGRLEAGMRAYIQFGLDHPEHYRILFMGQSVLTADQLDELRRNGVTGLDRFLERCRQCVKAGVVEGDDAKMMAYGLWSAAHGMISLLIAKPHVDWPAVNKLTEHVVRSSIRGIAKAPENL
jgi:AcrR family transcriptional regulator